MIYNKIFDDAIRSERLEKTMFNANLFLKDYIEFIFHWTLEEYERSKDPAILFEFKKAISETSELINQYAFKIHLKIHLEGRV